jgi:hypothetical protein
MLPKVMFIIQAPLRGTKFQKKKATSALYLLLIRLCVRVCCVFCACCFEWKIDFYGAMTASIVSRDSKMIG